jgi:hypothetical protein
METEPRLREETRRRPKSVHIGLDGFCREVREKGSHLPKQGSYLE